MLRPSVVFSLGVCLSAVILTVASAQSITSGDVTGTVLDPSGAATPKATVTLTNTHTNASQTTVTSQQGTYRFAFVPPGTYNVTVSAPGFQKQQLTGIVVTAGQPTVADARLAVAVASQSVEVSTASRLFACLWSAHLPRRI
jgi:ABC-type Na+ efflux pump permease subunit